MAEYTADADKAKRDRYLYVMALLVGQRGEADLEGKKIEGVLHTSTPFADLPHKIVLRALDLLMIATHVPQHRRPPRSWTRTRSNS